MANPRQRNKARSSKTTKPSLAAKRRAHHRLRKPPALNGPEVLQGGWDRHKTVFQNYKALGLLPSLPIPSSGSSKRQRTKLDLPSDASLGARFAGFGQIIRDEEGNVVDIIIPEDQDVVDGDDDEEMEDEAVEKTAVVEALEDLASQAAPIKRYTSTSEKTWLSDLVNKYGSDYKSMAKDKKLNVWQKTEGEIKRMVRKAGGVDKLRVA